MFGARRIPDGCDALHVTGMRLDRRNREDRPMQYKITAMGLLGSVLCLASPVMAQTELSMWYHGAGNEVESEIINQIVDDFNASQSEWKVDIEVLPAGVLQRLDRGGRAGRQPARHHRRGWTRHAQLGLVGLHAAAAGRRERLCGLPARHQGCLGRQALFGRTLGRGRGPLCAPIYPGGTWPAHTYAGKPLVGRRIHGRPGRSQSQRQV